MFLSENEYTDFSSPVISRKPDELFRSARNDTGKAKIAYEYVRDEIHHSFDINAAVITAKASDVLMHKTGICHAKSNLLAALLRLQGIPADFCSQHITLADDDSPGYCVHCCNAVFTDKRRIKADTRGSTNGRNAQFSLTALQPAFPDRSRYDEYFWEGICSEPHSDTMRMLEKADSLQEAADNIPDYISEAPDII